MLMGFDTIEINLVIEGLMLIKTANVCLKIKRIVYAK